MDVPHRLYSGFVKNAAGVLAVNAPYQLLEALRQLFPTYTFERDDYAPPEFTYHALLEDFTEFFGANQRKFTRWQLAGLAALINCSVARGGTLEHACETCCLDRLKQFGVPHTLATLLCQAARRRVVA